MTSIPNSYDVDVDTCNNQENINEKEQIVNIPTGVLYDINSKDDTIFKKNCMFKFIYENQNANDIPIEYYDKYVTEYNYHNQTPLMYATVLNNLNLVKILVGNDVGRIDAFNKSALDYAHETHLKLIQTLPVDNEQINSILKIIELISEYEYIQ